MIDEAQLKIARSMWENGDVLYSIDALLDEIERLSSGQELLAENLSSRDAEIERLRASAGWWGRATARVLITGRVEIKAIESRLAAMTAARDEACDLAAESATAVLASGCDDDNESAAVFRRVAALRKVGQP